ncbi:hypothetical protein [Rhizobium sp. 768_B6_N1_8]|uniref:hypothetical protein n=1 Tax=unclassified Rhizobium TaxID=2613769 RepID=UPI003F1F17E7
MTNFRYLTEGEINLGRSIYGYSIEYSRIKIYNESFLKLGPFSFQNKTTTITPDGNMYFPKGDPYYKDDLTVWGEDLQKHFIHELGHVYQHQHGEDVLEKAIKLAVAYADFAGDGRKYEITDLRNAKWKYLNIEQRAAAVASYWALFKAPTLDLNKVALYERLLPADIVRQPIFDNVPTPSERPAQCFPGDTKIRVVGGIKPIREIQPNDLVLAFDPSHENGRGPLVPRRVIRVFRNVTTEWVKLSWAEEGAPKELICTPGHHFLDEFGQFPPIENMIKSGRATVVLASGALAEVAAERIVYSTEAAQMFEQAQILGISAGGAALQPVELDGWQTYNFEVEELHTYVAGGVKVHNVSDPIAHNGRGVDYQEGVAKAFDVPGYGTQRFSGAALDYYYNSLGGATGFAGTAIGWGLTAAAAANLTGASGFLTQAIFGVAYAEKAGPYSNPATAQYLRYSAMQYVQTVEAAHGTISPRGFFESLGPARYGEQIGSPEHVADRAFARGYSFLDVYSAQAGISPYSPEAYHAVDQHRAQNEARRSGSSSSSSSSSSRSPSRNSSNSHGSSDYGPSPSGNWSSSTRPVLLDLSGNGLSVEALPTSSKFLDLDGDGYQHRTAWAGAGIGVLVIDADGDGKITRSSEFAFTEWDSAATGDLEALRHIFDTNGNGKLDAGDAQWSKFRVEVNGQLVTLDSLGITSIDLTPTGSGQTFEDGSAITGTTTFTRADGTTGTVGDAKLANDDDAYIIKTTSTTKADNSLEKTILAYNTDGSLAFRNVVTTSADGRSIQTQFDDDGNGTFDRSQTNVLVVDASGVQTKTVSNFNTDGSLADRTTTVTSADHLTVTTTLDNDGDGIIDQRQTYVRNADGSNTTTTEQLSINGTVLTRTKVDTSANGLTKTTSVDVDANGTVEDIITETTVIGSDGSRTKTVDDKSSAGKLLSRDVTVTSADNKTSTLSSDEDGDGDVDTKTVSLTTIGSSGDISVANSVYNGDGTLRGKEVTTTSADGRSTATSTDQTGDGIYDLVESDVSVVGTNGAVTQTVQQTAANGRLLSKVVTTRSADGKTVNETADTDGDGVADRTTAFSTNAAGYKNQVVSVLNADGSLVSKVSKLASPDGLSQTIDTDADGDGTAELLYVASTTANADGSKTETSYSKSANSTLLNKTITITSADSLTQTITTDSNGDGVIDVRSSDTLSLLADGTRTETVKTASGDGTLLSQEYTVTAANRQVTTVSTDSNGDGVYDKIVSNTKYVGGNTDSYTRNFAADGTVISRTATAVTASGLATLTNTDLNNDGVMDSVIQDLTSFWSDGSRTDSHYVKSGNNTVLSLDSVQTSGNKLSILTRRDLNGDSTFDILIQDTTVLGADGSRTQTVTTKSADGALSGQTRTVTSASGLQLRSDVDANGDGTFERSTLSTKTLNSDGSTTQTTTVTGADASLIGKSVTTVSADGRTSQATSDIDGDGANDRKETVSVATNGLSTDTVETYKADGTLASRAVSTVTANGLTKTTKSDLDGNGTFEEQTSSTRSVGADGATTHIFSRLDVNNALVEKTTTVTSADGKTKSTSWADASGTTKRSMTDAVVVAQTGTTTETLSYLKADGSLESKTITTTDAHGIVKTTTKDIDGNGVIDQRITETVASNGSKQQKFEDLTSTGTVKSSAKVTTSANGFSTTADYDTNGDGTVDKRITSALAIAATGVRTTVVQESIAGSGGLALGNKLTTTVSGTGLQTQIDFDKGGDGTVDQSSTDTTVLNADGSRTQDVKILSGTTLASHYMTTTSANGLSVSQQWDPAGTGTYSQTSTDVTALNADGTKVRTVTNLRADGSVISKSVTTVDKSGNVVRTVDTRPVFGDKGTKTETTLLADGASRVTVTGTDASNVLTDKAVVLTSADKARVTIERDVNGDGIVDQRQQVTTANTGVQTSVITDLKADGTVADKTTTTVSADGRQTTMVWDYDGNGTNERQRIINDTIRADGGRTTVMTDTDLVTNKVAAVMTTELSSDGRTTTTTKDVNGDNAVDQTETVTKDLFGNIKSVVSNNTTARNVSYLSSGGVYWKQAIAAKLETTTSADGRTKTSYYDYDGDGIFEVTMQSTQQIDGSIETVVTEKAAAGATVGKGTLSTSADGLISKLTKDADNNGTTDHTETSVKHIDGSITLTKVDLNTTGSATQTVIDIVNALGSLSSRTTKDSLGRKTEQLNVAADGSSVKTTYDAASGLVSKVETASKAGLAVSATYFDPLSKEAWRQIDQTFNAAGKLSYQTTRYDNGYTYDYTFNADETPYSLVIKDGAEKITQKNYYFADGGYDVYVYDPYNNSNFSYYWDSYYYNSSTQKYYLKTHITYRDDTGQTKYDATLYDYLNQYNWASIYGKFDKYGNREYQITTYDDGTQRPVLLDLDGDGHIDLRPLDLTASNATFDWDGDGVRDQTAWVGPNDGFLAIDLGADGSGGPDGIIDQARELAFAQWPENDGTADISDLDGLRLAFDTNHDNILDANDARWGEFRIWRDSNQNGISDVGELLTMSEAGIKLVNLIPNPGGAQAFDDGSAISGTSSYETTNGQTHLVADASLAWQKNTNGVAA